MFLNENRKDKTIYALVNNHTVKSAAQLIDTIYKDRSCMKDLNDIGIIYKGTLYNMSEIPEHILNVIAVLVGGAAAFEKRNKLLRNTSKEFKCEGV